jgi:hypothetical protein
MAGCDDARMRRPLLIVIGALFAGAGLFAGIASLAAPWARYRVSGSAAGGVAIPEPAPLAVFQVAGGMWYLLALGLLAGLLVIAALDTGRAADVALAAAPTLGIVTALGVIALANGVGMSAGSAVAMGVAQFQVTGETAYGVWIGLVAGPLLGFGTGAVALGRRRAEREAEDSCGDHGGRAGSQDA